MLPQPERAVHRREPGLERHEALTDTAAELAESNKTLGTPSTSVVAPLVGVLINEAAHRHLASSRKASRPLPRREEHDPEASAADEEPAAAPLGGCQCSA